MNTKRIKSDGELDVLPLFKWMKKNLLVFSQQFWGIRADGMHQRARIKIEETLKEFAHNNPTFAPTTSMSSDDDDDGNNKH